MTEKDETDKLEQQAITFLDTANPDTIEEGQIEATVRRVANFATEMSPGTLITEEEIRNVIADIEARFKIFMDTGSILKEDNYQKWYRASRAERGTKYWERYNEYLLNKQNMPPNVIQRIDGASDDMMEVLGDPRSDVEFKRKGLVIGAVQSGKTSNYIALINKAADSGYKVFILLTGTVEKLRQQTQERIDAGFVGRDSKDSLEKNRFGKNGQSIGVGIIDPKPPVASFTSTVRDFYVRDINMSLNNVNGPIIFVTKKNKSVLEKLYNWLKLKNTHSAHGKIDYPVLLIDDEADNASINTNDPDKDPTAINHQIRQMLGLFTRYSYVGFTATPFANIFINPQLDASTDDGSAKDDLFPKDFIYLLEQPSNYVGPDGMYLDDGAYHYMLRYNDDMENILPLKHKKGTYPSGLPESLKNAIDLFLLANAVRDLRGQEKKDRSMLIHVSRFISVQKNVEELVKKYFDNARVQIKNYSRDEDETEYMARLHALFETEYGQAKNPKYEGAQFEKKQIPETWGSVKLALYKAIAPIQIHTINSGSATQRLDYSDYPDGLRLIAIGGLSLARGLTLEGLTVSYFYRNTKMYDTLMQMGRWFGYRDGYSDLCRLWTSEESANWYSHITEATEDLRSQIRQMAREGRRPIDFGLRVRSAEDTPLIVTAKNKMTSTKTMPMKRQLNGQVVETPLLYSELDKNQTNSAVIENWIRQNSEYIVRDRSILGRNKPTLKNVPKQIILNLLELLEFPYVSLIGKDSAFVQEIRRRTNRILNVWDVAIASNDQPEDETDQLINFGGFDIFPIQRSFDLSKDGNFIRISKSKKRLGNIGDALLGMDKATRNAVVRSVKQALENNKSKAGKKRGATQSNYFNTNIRRNPLLVIYPIQLKVPDASGSAEQHLGKELNNSGQRLVCGISIGIPDTQDEEPMDYEYVINQVAYREILEGTSNQSNWHESYDEDDNETGE